MLVYTAYVSEVYRSVLDKQRLQSDSVAVAIRDSKLPREKKVELLSFGAEHKDLFHRAAIIPAATEPNHARANDRRAPGNGFPAIAVSG